MPAAVRFGGLLQRAARLAGEWPMADRSGGRGAFRHPALPGRHPDPRNRVHDRERKLRRDRLYAATRGRGGNRCRADCRRPAWHRRDAHGVRAPLRLWLHRAVGPPARRRDQRRSWPPRGAPAHAGAARRREFPHHSGIRRRAGAACAIRADLAPVAQGAPAGARRVSAS